MKIHKVTSSAVEQVGYDRTGSKLAIKFVGGKKYVYLKVGKDIYTKMRKASSIGRFVNNNILGKYESQIIEE